MILFIVRSTSILAVAYHEYLESVKIYFEILRLILTLLKAATPKLRWNCCRFNFHFFSFRRLAASPIRANERRGHALSVLLEAARGVYGKLRPASIWRHTKRRVPPYAYS
jgi:hypothetical protein